MPIISLSNIVKTFQSNDIQTTSLNNVSLEIDDGDFIAIVGESGSGKTTLLNIIGLLGDFDEGSYTCLGQDVSLLKQTDIVKFRSRNIGYIFQNYNLIDDMTVYENIELPLKFQNIPKAERRKKVEAICHKLGIGHRINHYPASISGGQQQRVACARALVSGCKLLVADEPTGNLDKATGTEVLKLFKEINNDGTTIVMVTHSNLDAAFANKKIVMSDGCLEDV